LINTDIINITRKNPPHLNLKHTTREPCPTQIETEPISDTSKTRPKITWGVWVKET